MARQLASKATKVRLRSLTHSLTDMYDKVKFLSALLYFAGILVSCWQNLAKSAALFLIGQNGTLIFPTDAF